MPPAKSLATAAAGLAVLAGLWLRFHHISDNQFLFYDEGMYLGYNRAFLDMVAANPPHDLHEFGIILGLMFKTALTTAKALWFFLLNFRVFFLGAEAWDFARWISAVSGLATVGLLYLWARRYFQSQRLGLLSALLLLLLPSHVFYSRSGMQESFSTLLFLSAVYLYMFDSRIGWRFFVSAFLLSCVYLTNYRMIIAPMFIIFIECFNAFCAAAANQPPSDALKAMWPKVNWPKIVFYVLAFYGMLFGVGSLYGGVNLHINFAWMFHQAQDAGGKFNPVNFLSYPYYVFALEGFFFACFFWGNVYFLKFREYRKFLPFCIVVVQMLAFSFAAEKGARYLCVVLPFMAAAAAVAVENCWQTFVGKRVWVLTAGVLALGGMIYLSAGIALAQTDYERAVRFITDRDPQAVIVSTQPLVEGLFMADEKRIVACPNDLYSLLGLYKQGARYLIVDPQAYISWTSDGKRFSPPLDDFLEVVIKDVQPLQTFPHLNNFLLNRFVLDHNEQILDSIRFLSTAQAQGYGKIRMYELSSVFSALQQAHTTGVL